MTEERLKDKFTTHKGDFTKVGKLTPEQLEEFNKTGKLPQEILDRLGLKNIER